ncbi:phage tail tape measure protein [Candidatus Bartonella washoeensis]|uniref:Phage tail tape measure protein, TP901 family, core region n=1 Tax=Cardidatus Bartonella washoeensis 085-0475 TaxID=1094564 RepID=J1JFI2_9HYPH|nr:phage tail tape measure protein [Bartonella washoeensis]EJF82865.1 phage tail tape measure protein, TP901 family, core region [Bartonella washoeensis 085-0475]
MSEKVADAKVKLSLEDKLTAPLKHLQKKFDTLSKTLSHRLSIPRFSAAVKNMTSSLKGVQGALSTAASRASVFTGALGLAGGGLVASVTAITMKTMHLGDSLHHASRHLGMSVASLQLWGDAADNSGYSAELFQQSLATLNRRSAQAYAGQKRGIMGFEALGISVKDASGKLKSNSVLLEEITDKMSKMKNQAQRQHIAALLFGGDGKEMAAMLAQGMAPIKELFAKARKGKWLIGADVAHYAADLSDKMGAFKKKIGGIASFIGARFMPVINDMIDGFSRLIDENRDLIQTTVASWAKTIKKVFNDLLNPTSDLRKGISDLTERIKSWFQWMEPLIGEITLFKVGLVALGSFIFGPLITSLAVAGAAFVTLGYTIMTTPIGWLIGGIAAIVVLYKYWDKLNGWVAASLAAVGVVLIASVIPAITAVGSAFISLGIAIMTTPIGWILGGIALLVGAGYLLYKNWDTVISFLGKLWDSFSSLCSNVFSKLFTLFKNFSPLYWIAKKINALIKWLFGVDLMDAGANLIGSLWDGIKSKWQALSEWFSGMISKLTSWMPNWVKEKLGFNVSINKTSTQTIKTFTDETNARAKRMVDTAVVTKNPFEKRKSGFNTGTVETRHMEVPNAKVAAFKAPKPITVHKPVEVDARVTITNLNISVPNGLKNEIRDAVNQALERYAKQQRLAIASSLSD